MRGPSHCRWMSRRRRLRRAVLPWVLALAAACASRPVAPVRGVSEAPVQVASPPGIRLHTGSPEGGLPYRLLVSEDAAASDPHRLVVWLHPSGGDGLALVEPLAADLARRGFALLTLSRKDFSGWRGADANRVMLTVVPDAARVPGVDARRPVLLGFSAGAQMALELWSARPEAFGGLLLLAGAPRFSRGDEASPPSGAVYTRVPLLALVGAGDGDGPVLWRRASETWSAAGVPLQVRVVSGRGHEWLLTDPVERELALGWLAALPPVP
jgi:predicted esterase